MVLRVENRQWQTTFDAAQDAICLIDNDQRILQANTAMGDLTGTSVQNMIGRHCWEVVHRTQMPIPECPLRRARTSLRREQLDLQIGEHWLHITVDPVLGPAQEFTGAVHIMRDITERKQLEEALRQSQEHYSNLVENTPDLITSVDAEGRFVFVNGSARTFCGLEPQECIGLSAFDFVHPQDRQHTQNAFRQWSQSSEGTLNFENRQVSRSGVVRLMQWNVVARRSANGEVCGFDSVARDITDRRQAEEALRQSEVQLQCILGSTSDGILAIDHEGKVIRFNQQFGKLWQVPQSLLDAKDDQVLLDYVVNQLAEPEEFVSRVQALYGSEIVATDTISFKDGRIFERFTSPLMLDTFAIGRIWSFRDITKRKQMEEQVLQLAFYDTLTRLPNRRLLGDRLGHALAASRRSGCYGVLLFLDFDNFKSLNDTHGHSAGDLLLEQAANRMKTCVREIDTVARLGGDEFVVMVDELNTDRDEATAQAGIIAEKIRTALAVPYVITAQHKNHPDVRVEHRCTASIGVVVFIDREGTQSEFLGWADTAMYRAKDAGGNLIRFCELRG